MTSQKATAILQGRVGSSRLPGKVLLPLCGKPVMQHVYERVLHCKNIDRIIVATSTTKKDDPIVHLFEELGVTVFRGSESDPLDRYYKAASQYNLSHFRWTLDHEVDYRFMTLVYDALYNPTRLFTTEDVLKLLETNPELAQLNKGIPRDEGIRNAVEQEQAAT